MKKILLDTHSLLWYFQDDERLSATVADLLENSENELYVSIVSLWEIAIKINIGKLQLECSFSAFLSILEQYNIDILPITLTDLKSYLQLPLYHRDPFDRILVTQTVNNNLILLSRDSAFDNYSIQRLW